KNKQNKKIFAIKKLQKVSLYRNELIESTAQCVKTLTQGKNHFITKIKYVFHDEEFVYIVTDYFSGGDLRKMMNKEHKMEENEIKFLIANILIALSDIRKLNIVHCDLKPENLMFDVKGFLYLIDFGLCKFFNSNSQKKFISFQDSKWHGTKNYVSPELFYGHPQEFASDYFSLGIILYELIFGDTPIKSGTDEEEIKEFYSSKKHLVSPSALKNRNFECESPEVLCSFMNGLLEPEINKRLGRNSIEEIFSHRWIKNINFQEIRRKNFNSPFKSKGELKTKGEYQGSYEVDLYYNDILEEIQTKELFKNFYYNAEEDEDNAINCY
ncbi:MAG: protein kinase, partial [archaeon]|nr:protein kinase [archaeon]